ncbi:MAG: hypothetical protein AB7F32_12070 [Victivallaceae bacterium]
MVNGISDPAGFAAQQCAPGEEHRGARIVEFVFFKDFPDPGRYGGIDVIRFSRAPQASNLPAPGQQK